MSSYRRKKSTAVPPQPGWAIYLRTSSEDNQKPELSRARQRSVIEGNVLAHSELQVIDEYIDVLTGKTPNRVGYQRLLADARVGKFSHVIVERADRFGRNDTEALRAIDELHEFGVSVRFANSPDLDPMDPDDRVLVALSFTLARRESALLGIRSRGGQQAKRKSGGYISLAPDGYRNVTARTDIKNKTDLGRWDKWVEIDTERAKIIREAWDLLLEDKYSIREIAETLHARGYRHRSGRPFVEVKPDGRRKANTSSLCNIFHNWSYAGWVVSLKNDILPKTVRGNWTPMLTTEEFERAQDILARRNASRSVKRKQFYLLTGLVFHRRKDGLQRKLTGSTSNAGRRSGGTPYYRIDGAGQVSFLCSVIDTAVAEYVRRIQVDPDLIPLVRASYTKELQDYMGHSRPDQRAQMQLMLKQIDEEEARSLRLYATGKISQEIWEGMWSEWQDRRQIIQRTLETMQQEHQIHIDNLDMALQMIAKIGTLYNDLQRSERKELLRQVVERVIVDDDGQVILELRSPFAYLNAMVDGIRRANLSAEKTVKHGRTARKNVGSVSPAVYLEQCSSYAQFVSAAWIRTRNPSVNSRLLCR
jgi:DNA invertase Pin-like site-specific DNA recombinase